MMRIPTITTLLSLLALFTFTPTRAVATNETESLTTKPEGNLIRKSDSEIPIFGKEDTSQSKLLEKQNNKNFLTPLIRGSSKFLSKPSQPELFSEPFYSGVPQKQNNEKNLSEGDKGAEVWAVQRRLQARGFDPGAVDSVFGALTTEAVRAFQESKGLTVTGTVDETTWTALAQPSFAPRPPIQTQNPPAQIQIHKILAKGDRGSQVKSLQVHLQTMGFNPGPIDGVFGLKTIGAVKEFQTAKGINSDGVVDQNTWEALTQK